MKKLLIALFGAALILGACGGADDPAPEETPDDTQEETQAPDETAGEEMTFDAARAEASYQSCAGCHGSDMQGQGGNPAIAGLPYDHVLNAIQTGPGTMPENMVTGEDAENLAAWIAAQE